MYLYLYLQQAISHQLTNGAELSLSLKRYNTLNWQLLNANALELDVDQGMPDMVLQYILLQAGRTRN
jgi:hypothetical protein